MFSRVTLVVRTWVVFMLLRRLRLPVFMAWWLAYRITHDSRNLPRVRK